MAVDHQWKNSSPLELEIQHGYLDRWVKAPRQRHPQVVLNGPGTSVLRILREELATCDEFLFSVAFVTPRAIALLKQELVEFGGQGTIVTSDYLSFNAPSAFVELLALERFGINVRLHHAAAFHPKGYIFRRADTVTAMVGSANLTENALVKNHEWNLKVTAATDSDLAAQLATLMTEQKADSASLTREWIEKYESSYVAPTSRPRRVQLPHPTSAPSHNGGVLDRGTADEQWSPRQESDRTALPPIGSARRLAAPVDDSLPAADPALTAPTMSVRPNAMQHEALSELAAVREAGERKAIVISATGTGKTMLSALDVRSVNPRRLLFVAHREQILDRTIQEYQCVLEGSSSDFGKLAGGTRDTGARYLFATVQTLARPETLKMFARDEFDYVIIDEAHRTGAATHRQVIEYFQPNFLLGMTATPERMDGFNVFELFDYNVAYEIRLNRALEEDMLAPFHYYGVTDVLLDDGETLDATANLANLVSPQRVDHVLSAIEKYALASVEPRGLMFCSRKDEAHALAAALNQRSLFDRPLRTLALTGEDSPAVREHAVRRLEEGELDYILTVDIFNEGVDIPSLNQIVMLRQTESAIVFVQQLGRGLRKAEGQECVIVLDFIGNYTNNFLIPVALFGDDSLNKESLKQHLIAAEEEGVLAGLASVRFDKISQDRVLRAINTAKLDSMPNLKRAIETLRNRLGRIPSLFDFLRFESVDPVVMATKKRSYPELVEHLLRSPSELSASEKSALELLSSEVLAAKRSHEVVLFRALLDRGVLGRETMCDALSNAGVPADNRHLLSAIDTLTLDGYAEADLKRYEIGVATWDGRQLELNREVAESYRSSLRFQTAVDDLLATGEHLVRERYADGRPFVTGRQYSRKEVTRLLCWPRKWTSTLYGYRVNRETGTCAIFVTLHKSEDISASTAYEDELLDASTLHWFTRSRRTLASDEVKAIVEHDVTNHVFVKKDDAEGTEFFYLGQATAHDVEQTTMPGAAGAVLDVVRMNLRFDQPIQASLFDYFHPSLTS
jgi:superfamily II DNA or RNA helicase/HKD family nuclease